MLHEEWLCKECLCREQRGKDPILNYYCPHNPTKDYPAVTECCKRITLEEVQNLLWKIPFSILEQHLQKRKEENESYLKTKGG